MKGRIVFSPEEIEARVRELASEVDVAYGGEPFVVVCVLKGAFFFFSDLVRFLKSDVAIDFVRLASYGSGTSSGKNAVQLTKDVEISIKDRNVLVVEDLVDSGRSMDFLMHVLAGRGARSVKLAVLVDKKERRSGRVVPDFTGFDLPEGFIVGYGMDYAEKYRNLSGIWVLDESEYL